MSLLPLGKAGTAYQPFSDATFRELQEMHELLLFPQASAKLFLVDSYIQGIIILSGYEDENGRMQSAAHWLIEYLRGTFD